MKFPFDPDNGFPHECECGAEWYDMEGGPCHRRCFKCGKLHEEPAEDYCEDCREKMEQSECPECGADWDEDNNRCTAQCQERGLQ